MQSTGAHIRNTARSEILRAIAHPIRIAILDALQGCEMCVGELADLLLAGQPTVSKHLAMLRAAGVVEVRRDGNSAYYRLTTQSLPALWGSVEDLLATRHKSGALALRTPQSSQ
ncbi:HTH-type transcriptional repressor SmtB [Phycisphaerae bacterium RAS1]|nr:HTH-type transcriptional repressor SmtB [Phycisphaerae bacterium RAS1]